MPMQRQLRSLVPEQGRPPAWLPRPGLAPLPIGPMAYKKRKPAAAAKASAGLSGRLKVHAARSSPARGGRSVGIWPMWQNGTGQMFAGHGQRATAALTVNALRGGITDLEGAHGGVDVRLLV